VTEKKGKVVLRLEVDKADAERVVAAIRAGRLADLGITHIDFPNHPELNSSAEGRAGRHLRERKAKPPHR
jgi:hypothetical protein